MPHTEPCPQDGSTGAATPVARQMPARSNLTSTLQCWLLAATTALLLAGCAAPRTGAQAMPADRREMTIQAPAEKVRAAAMKVMADRGYVTTPAGTDTLLFDRTAEIGASAMYGFLYSKEAWRRVRMTLVSEGAATRVTARAALLTNRGEAYEREEADTSGSALEQMQVILAKIRDVAQSGN